MYAATTRLSVAKHQNKQMLSRVHPLSRKLQRPIVKAASRQSIFLNTSALPSAVARGLSTKVFATISQVAARLDLLESSAPCAFAKNKALAHD
jgi:hypothetical protein